jgi:hypothetical protein
MKPDSTRRGLTPPWVAVGALILGAGLFLLVVLIINISRPPRVPIGLVTAALTVIPAPSATLPPPTSLPEEPTPAPDEPPAPPAGELGIGTFVEISGTGGDGLRLREAPGLENRMKFLGVESEIFKIEDGPQEVDGYTWWFLAAPFNESRNGWAVSNFLAVIPNP